MTDELDPPAPPTHGFEPGRSGDPAGRPKGARDRLAEGFLQALADDFAEHGAQAVVACRAKDPVAYCRVIAATLPKEVSVTVSELEGLADHELNSRIEGMLREVAAAGDQAGAGGAAGGEAAPATAH